MKVPRKYSEDKYEADLPAPTPKEHYSTISFFLPRYSTFSSNSYLHTSSAVQSSVHSSAKISATFEPKIISKKVESLEIIEDAFPETNNSGRKKQHFYFFVVVTVIIAVSALVVWSLLFNGVSSSANESETNSTDSPTFLPNTTLAPSFVTLSPTSSPTTSPSFIQPSVAPTSTPLPPFPIEIFTPGDTIGILFDERVNDIPGIVKVSIQKAVSRWNSITSGSSAFFIQNSVIIPEIRLCELFNFPEKLFADHLRLYVSVISIDGVDNAVAISGVCSLTNFPVVSFISLDFEDLNLISSSAALDNFFVREVGRGLGIGVLWQLASQGNINSLVNPLLQNPVFNVQGGFIGSDQPRFIGSHAVFEYNSLFGVSQDFVPVENGILNGVPLFPSQNQGFGIVDIFWDSDFMPGESFEFRLFVTPLISSITIASLEDMGYKTNRSLADSFITLSASFRGASPAFLQAPQLNTLLFDKYIILQSNSEIYKVKSRN